MGGTIGGWRLVSMTRTTHRWSDSPGNVDKLNTSIIYYSDNKYGIPVIRKDFFTPDWLVPFNQRIRTDKSLDGGAVHFFLDDYRFEHIWHRPYDTFTYIEKIGAALSPDFSTYLNYPIAAQIWNVYRNRWMGAFWQNGGVKVIPTISWSDDKSYDFCFAGVPRRSIVAISTLGVNRDSVASDLFKKGYLKMTEVIQPSLVLCYGESAPFNLEEYNKVKWYPSYWKSIRDTLKTKGGG